MISTTRDRWRRAQRSGESGRGRGRRVECVEDLAPEAVEHVRQGRDLAACQLQLVRDQVIMLLSLPACSCASATSGLTTSGSYVGSGAAGGAHEATSI